MHKKNFLRAFVLAISYILISFYNLEAELIWDIEVVDHVGVSHDSDLALDSSNNPHIIYGSGSDIRYAYYEDSWYKETVDPSVAFYISLALDSNNNPHISYYDSTNDDLKYAYYNGSWYIETVDSTGDVGKYTALALDSSNNPHISYYDSNSDDLKYAWYDGTWHIETVDSNGNVGLHTSLALDSSNNPHISYYDVTNRDLKYTWYDGTWHTETVDSEGEVGAYTSLALDSSNNPHIGYFDSTNHDLKYACYDSIWHTETVDDSDLYLGNATLALDSSNNPHISYRDSSNNNLKYAWYDGTWHIMTVDSWQVVGSGNSLDLDSNNNPHISYFDSTNGNLKYASICVSSNDIDCDGILNDVDNCNGRPNPIQEDADADTVGNVCDNCPNIFNFDQFDADGDSIGNACDNSPYMPALLPEADGRWYYQEAYIRCGMFGLEMCCVPWSSGVASDMTVEVNPSSCDSFGLGIMEFNIAGIDELFTPGQIHAELFLIIKQGNLSDGACLGLYDMQDESEDGNIGGEQSYDESHVRDVCTDLQQSDTIIFDVTSALEHDLYATDQTDYSGFIIGGWNGYLQLEFYNHTDLEHGPRLSISSAESDDDGIPNAEDNCPYIHNPNQEDSYPPLGNSIGDACDCEGNFDCDADTDGTDAATFKLDFGRNSFLRPCISTDNCNGDFSCDGDVDGTDAALFKSDFGRSQFSNPCPACTQGLPWCVYP